MVQVGIQRPWANTHPPCAHACTHIYKQLCTCLHTLACTHACTCTHKHKHTYTTHQRPSLPEGPLSVYSPPTAQTDHRTAMQKYLSIQHINNSKHASASSHRTYKQEVASGVSHTNTGALWWSHRLHASVWAHLVIQWNQIISIARGTLCLVPERSGGLCEQFHLCNEREQWVRQLAFKQLRTLGCPVSPNGISKYYEILDQLQLFGFTCTRGALQMTVEYDWALHMPTPCTNTMLMAFCWKGHCH